jgi:nucleotide-binding universal stress UspA family protein
MSYKTILVYFGLPQRVSVILDAVLPLARNQAAHLIGVTVIPPINIYSALAGEISAQLLEAEQRTLNEQAENIANEFKRLTDNQGVSVEWRRLDAGAMGIAAPLIEAATCADLVVVSQINARDAWEVRAAVPERILMESRRPLLLIPEGGATNQIGSHVLIGWNGASEAARAVFDAMPLLLSAEHVEVFTFGDVMHTAQAGFSPADDIAASIARHGVTVEAHHIERDDRSAGTALLARATEQHHDLLVIGGYGQSRFSEFIFGGVTRHVLANMSVPVLMSH